MVRDAVRHRITSTGRIADRVFLPFKARVLPSFIVLKAFTNAKLKVPTTPNDSNIVATYKI